MVKDGWSGFFDETLPSRPFRYSVLTGFGRDLNETADFDLAAKMVQTTGLDL
jgi:hypothetical protein